MSLSMYQLTVPVFAHALQSLLGILSKAEAFAEAKKLDASVLPNARLAPDMYPLKKQVQVVSDTARGGVARLAGIEVPSWPDDEDTLQQLKTRVQKTIDYVNAFTPAQIDGSEDQPIELKFASGYDLKFTGLSLVQLMVMPNLYFHLSIAYGILRHNGVELGKGDLLGKVQ